MKNRRFKRKRYSRRNKIYRVPNAFPRNKIVRHRYVENFTLPAGGAASFPSWYHFGANNMYDPNDTGTGHQPMYHDQYAQFYQYYTVLASYIKITVDQTHTGQNNYGIVLSLDGTLSNNVLELMEQYGGTAPLIPAQRNKPLVLRKSYDARRVFRTNLAGLLAEDTHKTAVGNNPAAKTKYLFSFWAGPHSPAVTMQAQVCQVDITYVCMWREPKDGTLS